MATQETGHNRCRQLRQNLRKIQSELSTFYRTMNAKRAEISEQRDQLSQHYSRLESLNERQIALGFGVVASGGVGLGASASSIGVAAEILQVENQIRVAESSIELLHLETRKTQENIDLFTKYEGETGREMTQLNCASS